MVTRISIDVLRSARVRREAYVGPWFPEPLVTDPYEDPERAAELADSVSMAALRAPRAAELRSNAPSSCCATCSGSSSPRSPMAVDRSEAACRQLVVRARRHMEEGRPRFATDRREREELAARFFDAFREGDVDGLKELLAADVQAIADGGGKGPAFAKPIVGSRQCRAGARRPSRRSSSGTGWSPSCTTSTVSRARSSTTREGKVLAIMVLDVLDGRIQTIRRIVNPEKLGHLGPVADAWAVREEVLEARRRLRG